MAKKSKKKVRTSKVKVLSVEDVKPGKQRVLLEAENVPAGFDWHRLGKWLKGIGSAAKDY